MTFQAPKGTRDFYPQELAALRRIEAAWRNAAVAGGFDEIDGPTYEHLELYTAKSGDGIVSELFSFRRSGGDVDYALRPEFTPTLARMAAARGRSLSVPTKWFAMPTHFRAERPQRGRLREHVQWNVDLLGIEAPSADAEVIATAIAALADLGLTGDDVVVRISHRDVVGDLLRDAGADDGDIPAFLELLDKRDRLDAKALAARAAELGVDAGVLERFDVASSDGAAHEQLAALQDELCRWSIADWCMFDLGIVRGLAYYSGIVFEIHERSGAERAIAGGGRYDGLVELFGGSPTPAVGLGMGDVVLGLVLADRGLLTPDDTLLPAPDAFVLSAGGDAADAAMVPTVAALRNAGLHARMSYKSTRNVGKLLTEASKVNARFAVILGEETADGKASLKDLASGEQIEVALDELAAHLAT